MSTAEFRIAQESRQEGPAWWLWWAWIEAEPGVLDAVREVVWHLHPTFPQSVVRSRDRSTRFRLDTSGWGEFTLRATVVTEDGRTIPLEHQLLLEPAEDSPAGSHLMPATERGEPEKEQAGEVPAPFRVFLAHSLADSDLARKLETSLREEGAQVHLPSEVGDLGDLRQSIAASDAVVALTSTEASDFVGLEAQFADSFGKPVFDILVGSFELPTSRAATSSPPLHLDRKGSGWEVERIAKQIVSSLRPGGKREHGA